MAAEWVDLNGYTVAPCPHTKKVKAVSKLPVWR